VRREAWIDVDESYVEGEKQKGEGREI